MLKSDLATQPCSLYTYNVFLISNKRVYSARDGGGGGDANRNDGICVSLRIQYPKS